MRRVCNEVVVDMDRLTESQVLVSICDDPPQSRMQLFVCVVHHSAIRQLVVLSMSKTIAQFYVLTFCG